MKIMRLFLVLGLGLISSNIAAYNRGYLIKIINKTSEKITVFRAEDKKHWTVDAGESKGIKDVSGDDYISWCTKPMEIRLGGKEGKIVKKFCQGAGYYARSCGPKETEEKCNAGQQISEVVIVPLNDFGLPYAIGGAEFK